MDQNNKDDLVGLLTIVWGIIFIVGIFFPPAMPVAGVIFLIGKIVNRL